MKKFIFSVLLGLVIFCAASFQNTIPESLAFGGIAFGVCACILMLLDYVIANG